MLNFLGPLSSRTKGHRGTGELGLEITTNEHFQAAKDLFLRLYEEQS